MGFIKISRPIPSGKRWLTAGEHEIASGDYPLIGPYDTGDPRKLSRWHFRLAKAAGLDGFICSWWRHWKCQRRLGQSVQTF